MLSCNGISRHLPRELQTQHRMLNDAKCFRHCHGTAPVACRSSRTSPLTQVTFISRLWLPANAMHSKTQCLSRAGHEVSSKSVSGTLSTQKGRQHLFVLLRGMKIQIARLQCFYSALNPCHRGVDQDADFCKKTWDKAAPLYTVESTSMMHTTGPCSLPTTLYTGNVS